MTYKFIAPQAAGYPPVEGPPSPVLALTAAALRTLTIQPGLLATVQDSVLGLGEVIFARANGAIPQFALCVLTPVWDNTLRMFVQNMIAVPNTANLGRAVFVAQSSGAMVAGQWGWFLRSGVTPINGTASVAADTAFGITAAGQIGANTAGKQVLGGRIARAGADSLTKVAVSGVAGAFTFVVDNVDGLFVGMAPTGTGIGAANTVTAIDQLSNEVTVSVANSAAVSGNIAFAFTNGAVVYNVAVINCPIAQGAIT
jgi:hypothetical protein